MTIYYQDDWVTLHHGDNRPILAGLADQSIDLVLTDPPYATTQLSWDQAADWTALWREFYRVCVPAALQLVFSAQPFTTDLINSNRANYRYELIWPKSTPTGFLDANRRPLRAHENIQVFTQAPNSTTYNPQKMPGKAYLHRGRKNANHYGAAAPDATVNNGDRYPTTMLPAFSNGGGTSNHPTAKPLELMCWLVATYSNPGDLILDPFGGSGSTAVAAKRLGRRCIIIEQEERYCEIAARRLSQDCMDLAS